MSSYEKEIKKKKKKKKMNSWGEDGQDNNIYQSFELSGGSHVDPLHHVVAEEHHGDEDDRRRGRVHDH